MKTKLLTILSLLVLCVTGAWAQAINITFAYDQINATGTGSASVDGIVGTTSVALVGSYQSFGGTANGSTYNNVAVPKYSKITVSSDGTTSASDYLRFTITPADGYRFTPSSVSLGAIREGTDNGSMTVKANSTTLTESTLSKTSVTPGRNKTGSTADETTKFTKDGYSFSYSISDIDATNDAPLHIDVCMSGLKNKSWGIWNVVITGTYEGTNLTKLGTPSISVNSLTGAVTISDIDANAEKVTYTTDGTDPTASSTTYSEPFTINANCTVKAIAIGDGASYSNSNIASQAAAVTVDDPVITAYNGTVGITCATDGATIKYNFDNGETWNTYSIPFTLFDGQTVYAKAESASYKNNSGTVNAAVTAAPSAEVGSSSITLYYDTETNFSLNTDGNSDVLTGKAGTDYEGFSITLDNEGQSGEGIKAISYGSEIDGKTTLKGSNGRKMTIAIPSNLRANRITIKSYNNGAISSTSLWSNVGGTTYTDANEVGLQCISDASNPDVRVFELADLTSIDIVNNGAQQQCFIATIDYTKYIPGPADPESPAGDPITWDFTGYSSKVTFTNGSSYSYKADDFSTEMRYTAGSSDEITANSYLKENGTSSNASCKDIDGETAIAKTRLIRLFVTGKGTLTINCEKDGSNGIGVYTIYQGNETNTAASGSALKTGYTANTTTDELTVTNGLWIETTTKGYITSIVWTPVSDDITLTTSDNMAGWRAFNPDGQGYTLDENTTAYIVEAAPADNTVTLVKTSNNGKNVYPNTPVILYTTSAADSHKMTLTAADIDDYTGTGNLLKVTTAAQTISNKYRLGYKSGDGNGVGFYPYSTGSAAAGIVYLDASSSGSAKVSIVFDDEQTTGIESIHNSQFTIHTDAPMYNLSGQRVGESYKGIVIVNGRKFVRK